MTLQLITDVVAAKIPFVVVFGSADPFNITGIIDSIPAIVSSRVICSPVFIPADCFISLEKVQPLSSPVLLFGS